MKGYLKNCPSCMYWSFCWKCTLSCLSFNDVYNYILKGLQKITPSFFEGLQNVLKGMWRVGPQNKGNSLSILFHVEGHFTHETESLWPVTFQALSLVEKAEPGPSSLHTNARGTDGVSMWMRDGCRSLDGSLNGIEWIMFHGHLECFQNPPLASRPIVKPGGHGHSEHLQPLICSIVMCEDPHK